jgi:hypothetical protein
MLRRNIVKLRYVNFTRRLAEIHRNGGWLGANAHPDGAPWRRVSA